ncbi:PTS sugar transporter subunit IIC [uncultured Desulfovibrio sp.]|uniref:PTS sugar transporter subunit IIC n=1 Tax=uncultured Desulfovibrio sp. TaxID=167968 RepID=UPI0034276822
MLGVFRHTLIFRLVDRPLFAALLMGLLTGDWLLALPLGITLELLWLDVVPLGSVVPPQGVLSFLLMFPLVRLYGWSAPGALLLPLLLAVLAAYAAAFAERSQRVLLNRIMPAVEGYCRTGRGCAPGHALLLGISLRACWQFALYLICFVGLTLVFEGLDSQRRGPLLRNINWPMMYVAAMLGAVLSLRVRKAYSVLLACLCLAAVALVLEYSL